MSGNRSKSAFFEGGGSLWAHISERRGHRPPTTVGVRKLEIAVSCYLNIRSPSFSYVTIHASDRRTDRQTDGHYFDSNTVRCITCRCRVKRLNSHELSQFKFGLFRLAQFCMLTSSIWREASLEAGIIK